MTFDKPKYQIAAELFSEGANYDAIAKKVDVQRERVSALLHTARSKGYGEATGRPPKNGKARRKGKTRRVVPGGSAKRSVASRRSTPKPLGAQSQAIIYLTQACALLQSDYRQGQSVRDPDPLIFLALQALTRRKPS
jgi:hypothetical protein